MSNIGKVRKRLERMKLNSFLISNATNIRYLTGFKSFTRERECYFVLSPRRNVLVVPRMYQAEANVLTESDFEVIYPSKRNTLLHTAVLLLKGKVGFEAADIKYAEYEFLQKKLNSSTPIDHLIENLRVIKDNGEIRKIKKAIELTDKVFNKILNHIRVGQTEFEIAHLIHSFALKYGAEDLAFPSIVALGKNSAMPHYRTSAVEIERGQMLLLDFGMRYKKYCGDLTRMVYLGEPDQKFVKIYRIVRRAEEAAIAAVADGVKAKKVHKVALSVFKKEGLEGNFLHGVGHGIGMDVHEAPSLSEDSETILKKGMVITIEPGVYIKGWGGVRIEDVVLVTKNGYKVLSKASRNIIRV